MRQMLSRIKVGIVAPSSRVPRVELKLGAKKILDEGFDVAIHPQCWKGHSFFAGTDEQRAKAFFEVAKDPNLSIVWVARGGSGALRILPLLEKMAKTRGAPKQKKLFIGYSDTTVLMEYARKEWGWSILHGPMPSMRRFSILPEADWVALRGWIRGKPSPTPWASRRLQFWHKKPTSAVEAPVVGGNLTVWANALGTPYEPNAKGCFLFLEDVDEALYRIDRTLQQLILSGSLNGIRGILLGNFLNCKETVPLVLKRAPSKAQFTNVLAAPQPDDLQPLRRRFKEISALKRIFSEVGQILGVPVAYGLPVGHGPEVSPLPLGARYRLTPEGRLQLLNWDWLK